MPEHLLNRAAVLALQAGEHHEPLLLQLAGLLPAPPRRLDLPELELEHIQLAFTRSRELAEPFDPGLELAQPGVGLAHARSELQMLGAAVRVQDVELSG